MIPGMHLYMNVVWSVWRILIDQAIPDSIKMKTDLPQCLVGPFNIPGVGCSFSVTLSSIVDWTKGLTPYSNAFCPASHPPGLFLDRNKFRIDLSLKSSKF